MVDIWIFWYLITVLLKRRDSPQTGTQQIDTHIIQTDIQNRYRYLNLLHIGEIP